MSENVFIPLLFFRDTSNGLRILGCSYFFLIHWIYHPDFYCYSWEIGSFFFFTTLEVFYYFYLPAFKMFSFSLWSCGFTEMYLGSFCLSRLWFIGLLKNADLFLICSRKLSAKIQSSIASVPHFSPLETLRCMLDVLTPVSVSLCSSFIYSKSKIISSDPSSTSLIPYSFLSNILFNLPVQLLNYFQSGHWF